MPITFNNVTFSNVLLEGVPYVMSPSTTTVVEGNAVTFTVTAAVANTTLYWTINNGTSTNSDFPATSGSFAVTNQSGSFTVSTTPSVTTQGLRTFTVSMRTTSITGTVVFTSETITIDDTNMPSGAVQYTSSDLYLASPGTFSWTVPTNVFFICAVCIGAGGKNTAAGGGGGGLSYGNDIPTTPGETIYGQYGNGGNPSWLSRNSNGSSPLLYGGGGGNGQLAAGDFLYVPGGGGGAGGYGGSGGNGGNAGTTGTGTTMTGGSGGSSSGSARTGGGNGGSGGTGIVSQSPANSGTAGFGQNSAYGGAGGNAIVAYPNSTSAGDGGDCGMSGGPSTTALSGLPGQNNGYGTAVGGGGGGSYGTNAYGTPGNNGGVRIIWGSGRSYPSNAQ